MFGGRREVFGIEVVIDIHGCCGGINSRRVLLKDPCGEFERGRNHS